MANDLFGGLLKNIGNLIPSDNPDMQMFSATNELSSLKDELDKVYAKIGKEACRLYPQEPTFAPFLAEAEVLKRKIEEIQAQLEQTKAEQEQKQAAKDALICPECGEENKEGAKFCQSCGGKLKQQGPSFCTNCGAQNAPGVKFCSECGQKME